MLDLLVSGGTAVLPQGPARADVGVADGRIAAVGDLSAFPARQTIDVSGLLVLPALVDGHVHFNDPGLTEREDFYTGSCAAAAGGVGSVVEMPLSGNPTVTSVETLEAKKTQAAAKSVVDYGLWGGLVNDNVSQMEAMSQNGALCFKAFTCFAGNDFPYANHDVLWRGLVEAGRIGALVGVHCEDEELTSVREKRARAEGRLTVRSFLEAHAPETEELAVAGLLVMARRAGARVHVCHATLAEVVDMVTEARKYQPATVETCPHYLVFNESDLERLGGELKCTPAIRTAADVERLWDRVLSGKVDMICSDHSPSTIPQKNPLSGCFWDAWGGTEGVQTTLSVLYGEGVVKRGMSLTQLTELLCSGPAKVFGLFPQKGQLALGSDGDLTLFDPNARWTVTPEALFYKNRHSPYMGMELCGKVKTTIVRGTVVYDGNKVLAPAGFGRLLSRQSGGAGADK